MNKVQFLILAVLFLMIFGGAALAMLLLTRDPVKERLLALDDRDGSARLPERDWRERLARLAEPLAKLSVPTEGWEGSPARLRFINAGWRAASTPGMFYAGKTALTIGLPLAVFMLLPHGTERAMSVTFLYLIVAATAGYYVPDIFLKRKVSLRQREIFESFPDALDLMTVCVEAGLAMDAALARVGAEIGLKSPVLAEELQLVTLELRAGSAKEKALRNLALRVQSEQLRTRRRQLIEENAGKIATKLLFPLIFCIFPALLVVLLGPAVLQIMRSLGTVSVG